jgi:hypothetical protein
MSSRAGHARSAERRAAPRYLPGQFTTEALLAADGEAPCLGTIREISAGGISLRVAGRYQLGSVLTVGLTSGTGFYARSLRLRVVRVDEREDGTCIVAGAFAEKPSADDLQVLLV